MDIVFHARVECTDGVCGEFIAALIYLKTKQLRHLVVQALRSPQTLRLVPIERVDSSDAKQIRLNCARHEFKTMPEFVRRDYIRKMVPSTIHGDEDIIMLPAQTVVLHLEIPPGEEAMSAKASVNASDGVAGKVDELRVEPRSRALTHIVLREGHLWGKKHLAIPFEHVTNIHDNAVQVNLTRHQLDALPMNKT